MNFQVTGTLLAVGEGEFQGNDYMNLQLRSDDVAEGDILKYKINLKTIKLTKLELLDLRDSVVTATLEIVKGQGGTAGIRVISVE